MREEREEEERSLETRVDTEEMRLKNRKEKIGGKNKWEQIIIVKKRRIKGTKKKRREN